MDLIVSFDLYFLIFFFQFFNIPFNDNVLLPNLSMGESVRKIWCIKLVPFDVCDNIEHVIFKVLLICLPYLIGNKLFKNHLKD